MYLININHSSVSQLRFYIAYLIITKMECPRCNLRYNLYNRTPKVNPCGHSLCDTCLAKVLICPTCQVLIDRSKSIQNHSLMQVLEQKRILQDIDKFVKVCFVGQSQVGKTSLIGRLRGQQYKQNTITTIGYDFAFADRVIDGLNVRFQLWDSAGQERYRAVSPLHYKNSDIVVIVYDSTQNSKANNAFSWLEEAIKNTPQNSSKIFVGNKTDLLQSGQLKTISPLDAETWQMIAKEQLGSFHISCKTYEGIEELWGILQDTLRKMLKKISNENSFKPSEKRRKTSSSKGKKQGRKKKLSEMRVETSKMPFYKNCEC